MILKAEQIAKELAKPKIPKDPLIIRPLPDLKELEKSGAASIDIRLGCWFQAFQQRRLPVFDVYDNLNDAPTEEKLTKMYYVPFGSPFILHPKTFVLGITLEWFRIPGYLAGYVVGRSSWGRHGLIIATATGVHPGFTGCLALELTNVGEIPITIKPGSSICQLFLHQVEFSNQEIVDKSRFIGKRKPSLSSINLDRIALKLSKDILIDET